MTRDLATALAVLTLLTLPAQAQKTPSALTTEINSNLPDQNVGQITPAVMRQTLTDMANSNMVYGTLCPSGLGPYQLFANTSGAPTTSTLNVWDTAQCLPWLTINPSAHTLSIPSAVTLAAAPVTPVIQPSSGNIVGSGCATPHQIPWADQNLCLSADIFRLSSADPSAVLVFTLSGPLTVGGAITMTFTSTTGACSAGCSASYTIQTGDTLPTVGAGLACAITGNPNLFSLNGGSCSGGVATTITGGYGSGALIGLVVVSGNGFALDYDPRKGPVTFKYVVSGTATVMTSPTGFYFNGTTNTSLPGGSTVNTNYQVPNAWDNNPGIIMYRNPGFPPGAASALSSIVIAAPTTQVGCTALPCAAYGIISNFVCDSTAGHLQSQWILQAQGGGSFANSANGLWVGAGAFTNFGGSPCNGGTQDMGGGTFNAGVGYYIAGFDVISRSGTTFGIAGSTDTISITNTGGIGINATPSSAHELNIGNGVFITGTTVPTTGTGLSLSFFGGNANIISENFGTSTLQPLILDGSAIFLLPGGVTNNGVELLPAALFPVLDNQSTLGTASLRWTALHTIATNLYGTTSGSVATTCAATCGAHTVAWATGGSTFSDTLTAGALVSGSTINGAGNEIITKASGTLSIVYTASASAVQASYISAGGTLFTIEDTTAGLNQKFFNFGTAAGLTFFRTLTDAQAVQQTVINITNSTGVANWPLTTASTSSTTGAVTFSGGVGVAGAIYGGAEITTGVTAVGTLPTCNSAHKGARHFVTDANATTFNSAVAAGGANNVPVTCNGTSWVIGANDNILDQIRKAA